MDLKQNTYWFWIFTKHKNVFPDIEMKFPSKLLFIGLCIKVNNYKAIKLLLLQDLTFYILW